MADTNIQILADRKDIVAVADAVRAKTGTTEALTLGDMVTAIENISGGGSGTALVHISSNSNLCDFYIAGITDSSSLFGSLSTSLRNNDGTLYQNTVTLLAPSLLVINAPLHEAYNSGGCYICPANVEYEGDVPLYTHVLYGTGYVDLERNPTLDITYDYIYLLLEEGADVHIEWNGESNEPV